MFNEAEKLAYLTERQAKLNQHRAELFQHFDAEEAKERHLQQVKEAVEVHGAPF